MQHSAVPRTNHGAPHEHHRNLAALAARPPRSQTISRLAAPHGILRETVTPMTLDGQHFARLAGRRFGLDHAPLAPRCPSCHASGRLYPRHATSHTVPAPAAIADNRHEA